jgi:hypothetical protein
MLLPLQQNMLLSTYCPSIIPLVVTHIEILYTKHEAKLSTIKNINRNRVIKNINRERKITLK